VYKYYNALKLSQVLSRSANIVEVFNDPRMTSGGRRLAFLIAVGLVLFLPKRVEGLRHDYCVTYKLEPLGVYGIESVLGRDLGIAYTRGEDCR
jgi:hypothetical protein